MTKQGRVCLLFPVQWHFFVAPSTPGTYHDPMEGAASNGTVQRTTSDSDLLDVTQVARRLNVGKRFVYRLISEGRIKNVKVGRYVRFHPEDVQAFVDAGARPLLNPEKSRRTSR
jgi:excisionase family DNA binding protein